MNVRVSFQCSDIYNSEFSNIRRENSIFSSVIYTHRRTLYAQRTRAAHNNMHECMNNPINHLTGRPSLLINAPRSVTRCV